MNSYVAKRKNLKSTDAADYQHLNRPVAAMAKDFPAGYRIEPHAHTRAQLIFAASGVMEITTDNNTWVVPTGRAVWVSPGTEHAINMLSAVTMRTLYIAPTVETGLLSCQVVSVSNLLRALILASMDIPLEYNINGRDGLIMQLIVHELHNMEFVPLHASMPNDPRLITICQAILEDPSRTETLAQWGSIVGATSRTLANHFLAETGLTFGRWRQQARLVEAVRRLALGQSASTVALELGYRSQSAFIAMFRRALGTTPTRYFDPPPAAQPADETEGLRKLSDPEKEDSPALR